ncbi:MAG: hypothetical protein AAFV19_09110 [Pseudomonadota bacterium]
MNYLSELGDWVALAAVCIATVMTLHALPRLTTWLHRRLNIKPHGLIGNTFYFRDGTKSNAAGRATIAILVVLTQLGALILLFAFLFLT